MIRFVVLSTGRSGSKLFRQALSQHPSVHCYQEVYRGKAEKRPLVNGHRYQDAMNPVAFCREHVWREPNEFEKTVIGFKLFHYHARQDEQAVQLWDYLRERSDIKRVLLLRENVFDTYVSTMRARQNGVWHLSDHARTEERLSAYNRPLTIDVNHCVKAMNSNLAGLAWMQGTFGGENAITVTYEQMKEDLQGTLDRVYAHLGVSSHRTTKAFNPLSNVKYSDGIANWEQVRRRLATSIYRDMLATFQRPSEGSDGDFVHIGSSRWYTDAPD